MRYRIEVLYKNNTFDMVCIESYKEVVELIVALRRDNTYKDIRVYKLVGQYKNENMEIQHNY